MTDWPSLVDNGGSEAEKDRGVEIWRPGSYELLVRYPEMVTGRSFRPQFIEELRFVLDEVGGFLYVVVDEVIDDVMTAVVSPWPWVDEDGALVFRDSDAPITFTRSTKEVQIPLDRARGFLAERGILSPGLASRALQVGDVFGLRPSPRRGADALGLTMDTSPSVVLGPGEYPEALARDAVAVERDGSNEDEERRRFLRSLGAEVGPAPPVPMEGPTVVGLFVGDGWRALDVTWDAVDAARASYSATMSRPLDPAERAGDAAVQSVATLEAAARLWARGVEPPAPSG